MEETDKKWARQRQEATNLCKEVGQEYPACGFHIGDGWKEPVAEALRKLAKVGIPWTLAQVKQKFCGLRIYADVDLPNEGTEENPVWGFMPEHSQHAKYQEFRKIISEAETACDTRCESCGATAPAGQASGWKGCPACKTEEKKRYEEKYGKDG